MNESQPRPIKMGGWLSPRLQISSAGKSINREILTPSAVPGADALWFLARAICSNGITKGEFSCACARHHYRREQCRVLRSIPSRGGSSSDKSWIEASNRAHQKARLVRGLH